MAVILNDKEIKKLIKSSVIKDGEEACVRSNSYILRLGSAGRFIATGKDFKLEKGKGIRVHPGQSVAITALETIDFSQNTVGQIFPDCNLHGILSPVTDLAREGVIAPATQIDAGFFGTLNWTINNTSNEKKQFAYGEKLFRLTIFRLEKDEVPEKLYSGDYQGQLGLVPSQRKTAHAGMRNKDWTEAYIGGTAEDKLRELRDSGFPGNLIVSQFEVLDGEIKQVSEEYADIRKRIESMDSNIKKLENKFSEFESKTARAIVHGVLNEHQNTMLLKVICLLGVLAGSLIPLLTHKPALNFIIDYGVVIGPIILVLAVLIGLFAIVRRKTPSK